MQIQKEMLGLLTCVFVLVQAGDRHGLMRIRREMLGLCRVAQVLLSAQQENQDGLNLSQAHYDLAQVS
jgi:hypothetical protein